VPCVAPGCGNAFLFLGCHPVGEATERQFYSIDEGASMHTVCVLFFTVSWAAIPDILSVW
jgi:hypothetical protein